MKVRDEGFTLVELMVVVLIIAILIAIAVPTFLGVRVRAQDRAVQANLRNSVTAARVFYADTEDYAFTVADLDEIHADMPFVAGNAPALGEVGFVVLPNADAFAEQAVVFITVSASGTWFCLEDQASGSAAGMEFGESTVDGGSLDTLAECVGGWS